MPVVIEETIESREQEISVQNSHSCTKRYRVQGTSSDVAVHTIVQATIPAFYLGMNFSSYTIRPQFVDAGPLDRGVWDVNVTYARIPPRKISMSTGGGTQRITKSLQTISTYQLTAGQAAPNFQGAIGVNNDSVEGTDIIVPTFQFTIEERRFFTEDQILDALVRYGSLVGKVNDGVFLGFEAGTLLLEDVNGTPAENSAYHEFSFKFAFSPNNLSIPIGTFSGGAVDGYSLDGSNATHNFYRITFLKGADTGEVDLQGTWSASQVQSTINTQLPLNPGFDGESVLVMSQPTTGNQIFNALLIPANSSVTWSATTLTLGTPPGPGPVPTQYTANSTNPATIYASKKGWEYLWIRYKDSVDASQLIKIPHSAYIEKVYRDGDFSQLDITETWGGMFANGWQFYNWFTNQSGNNPGGAS